MAQQFETSSSTRQMIPRYQGESSRLAGPDHSFEQQFFEPSRPSFRSSATQQLGSRLVDSSGLEPELHARQQAVGRSDEKYSQQQHDYQTSATLSRTWAGEFQSQATTRFSDNKSAMMKRYDNQLMWNEAGWLDKQLADYKLAHPENNFVLTEDGQLRVSTVDIPEERYQTIKVSLLSEAESQQLRQLIFDRYGFDVNLLIWDPEMKLIPADALSRLIRDLGMSDPYNYHDLIVTRDHVGSTLVYEELIRQTFHRELFAVPLVQLLQDERYSGLELEFASQRLTILNDFQYDTQADILNMSRQQLLDYIEHADYIPLAVIKTLSRWLLGRQTVVMRRDLKTDNGNVKVLKQFKRALVKEELKRKSQNLPPTTYRIKLPQSESELLDTLKRLHLSYKSYITRFSALEVSQLKHHLHNKIIRAEYLPETRDELLDAITKGSFKLYTLDDKTEIIKKLGIPYPIRTHPDDRLIDNKMFFDWLESTKHINVKDLSRDFLTGYYNRDFEAVKRVVTLTSRLLVPLSFDPFKSSGNVDIDELLLERVRDGKLKFINSSSRL